MVEKGLENLGIQVIAASFAMDGLRLVETEQPDVALVDVCLPEMNGFELFRKIRALDSKIPMIFVTSDISSETTIEAMRLGAFDYLAKPINLDQLRKMTVSAIADIDLKNDSRPLRNFLRGKSKANVTATKHLKVQLNDAQIDAKELSLTQECRIQPEIIRIVSTSDGPTGELHRYITTLEAVKSETGTNVSLSIDMTVSVHVAWLFQSQAQVQVDLAARRTLEEQEEAIRSLIENGATSILIR